MAPFYATTLRPYTSTPLRRSGRLSTHKQTPQYLSNHRLFPNPNPTQESPLLALSNAPSFVQFYETVLKIAFTHNISTTAQDIATPKDSLDARRIALQYEPNFTEIHAAV